MLMPTVNRYMTSNPLKVAPTELMSVAHDMMREQGVCHVPVVLEGKLLGIVSDRDLYVLEPLRFGEMTVGDVMQRAVSTVAPDAPLDEVIERMSQERCDAIAVVGKTGVVGIFTATDALWALTDLLRREAA